MSILRPGKYYIVNKHSGTKVGLSPEDPGKTRYAILSAPKNIHGPQLRAVTWNVEHVGGHLYKLVVEGRVAASENGKVFGRDGGDQHWTITEREGMGGYTIEETHQLGVGWVLEDGEKQVLSRHLIVGPRFPPFFPPTEIWEFERIEN
ncbi:hypothetical protein H0H81_010532 [Sphagnurus paluster]|uniref:Uncharacterized protein n=1 Tax=Sphagnurus paluster TaxID=117069 RepID=A0A9P7FQY0_9AGAR|nr:hypothetical protein H0H81_010532 [Sphagnurus paluster]